MQTTMKRRLLIVDPGISALLSKKQEDSSATEEDVRVLLRRYSTKDCLKAFSFLAREIFNNPNLPGREGPSLLIDEGTGAIVTQFALSYLSCMAILSGSNDYKSLFLKEGKENVLGICQVYNNCLPAASSDQSIAEEIKLHGPGPFLIRMNEEQFSYQISGDDMLARTFILFLEIAPTLDKNGLESLDIIHQKETGLSIEDFLWISFAFLVIGLQHITFRPSQLYEADIKKLKHIYTQPKVESFLKLMGRNYSEFRDFDELVNSSIPVLGTKSRFNPLVVYPIVLLQVPDNGNPYIIPNQLAYIRRATEGLFWWFDTTYDKNEELDRGQFRSYFGDVFQEYVGRILKAIYRNDSVMPEFSYGTKKEIKAFSDWWLIKGGKLYLFEVKAHQINLHNRRVVNIEKFKSEEVSKVAQAVKQLFKVVQDIRSGKIGNDSIPRDIEIIPIAVFYDVPFVAETGLYGQWLEEELQKLEKSSDELKGLSKFKAYPINVDELEPYESIADLIDIEEVFKDNEKQNPSSNISATMVRLAKEKKGKPHSKFLEDAYHRFFDSVIV